mmetsp:Transcript_9989/g.25120  ORF Transcript_9989/g.25120 Transcript_9989/m.25120 type:complete len:91 (+) Transcript_9989:236-508(+)
MVRDKISKAEPLARDLPRSTPRPKMLAGCMYNGPSAGDPPPRPEILVLDAGAASEVAECMYNGPSASSCFGVVTMRALCRALRFLAEVCF